MQCTKIGIYNAQESASFKNYRMMQHPLKLPSDFSLPRLLLTKMK